MASNPDFIKYVAEQLGGAGTITYRKMFGEYGLYCDGKFFATVEENELFVKITKAGAALLPSPTIAKPHGNTPFFLIEELEDRDFLRDLTLATCGELPPPKPKNKPAKKKKEASEEE